MEAILVKLEQAQVFEKINRAIPFVSILGTGYFVASWLFSMIVNY